MAEEIVEAIPRLQKIFENYVLPHMPHCSSALFCSALPYMNNLGGLEFLINFMARRIPLLLAAGLGNHTAVISWKLFQIRE